MTKKAATKPETIATKYIITQGAIRITGSNELNR